MELVLSSGLTGPVGLQQVEFNASKECAIAVFIITNVNPENVRE
jgi:hypothetical protein